MTSDAEALATARQIAADGAQVNANGVTLAEAAAITTASIYTKTWAR
jgi:hypothetical protein